MSARMSPLAWALALAAALNLMADARGDGMVPEGEPAPQVEPQTRPKPPRPRKRPAPPPVATPAPSPAPAPVPEPPPEPKRELAADEVVPILGRKVVGPSNEELGRVVNVLVDSTGRARAAVIDFGGFLGVGSRKVAVEWGQLQFKPGAADRQIGLTLTREQIQGAREYKENAPRPVELAVPPREGAPAAGGASGRQGASGDGKRPR
jgi:hypothetical protein